MAPKKTKKHVSPKRKTADDASDSIAANKRQKNQNDVDPKDVETMIPANKHFSSKVTPHYKADIGIFLNSVLSPNALKLVKESSAE